MQRSFTRRQRRRLWIESGNLCACCGGALGVDWEADHIHPWSMGGATILENAQALCRACNRRKGNTVIKTNDLRTWQQRASDQTFAAFQSKEYDDRAFLTVASTGAGKTRYAADVARRLFVARMCQQVIVIVPTLTVVEGWQDAMANIGIQIDDTWKTDRELTTDFRGVITTYQSALQDNAAAFVQLARHSTTMLIADEVHHGGSKNAWGNALERIATACSHRLFLTGTPIRNDNRRIPMVEYIEKTERQRTFFEIVPDYAYEYRNALADEVVRPARFHLEDSGVDFEIERGDQNKRIVSYSLMDRMLPSDESARLKAALKWDESLIRQMITTGNERISELRDAGVVDAGGIVTCLDIKHAKAVAKTVRMISGEEPVVVHADDPDAQTKINAFRDSRQRWIVSVKMISEGVDIPRLLVGVLATNVVATLFFKQFVGRCLRVRTGEDRLWAYIIAPKIPAYHENAKEFEDAVRHMIEDLPERVGPGGLPSDPTYVTTHATIPNGTTIVTSGVDVPPAYVEYARKMYPTYGPNEVAVAATTMYTCGFMIPQHSLEQPSMLTREAKPETAASMRKRKKKERNDRTQPIVSRFERLFPENPRPGAAVNENFKRAWGGRGVDALSIAEIDQQIEAARWIMRKMDAIEHMPVAIQRATLGELLRGMRGNSDALPDRHPGDAVADPVAERARTLGTEGARRITVP